MGADPRFHYFGNRKVAYVVLAMFLFSRATQPMAYLLSNPTKESVCGILMWPLLHASRTLLSRSLLLGCSLIGCSSELKAQDPPRRSVTEKYISESNSFSATVPLARFENGVLVQDSCTVVAIDDIQLPSRQDGIIERLEIELYSFVELNQPIGNLDSVVAQQSYDLAKLQAQEARVLADDQSDTEFAKKLLEAAQIELDAALSIDLRGSSSESELRRKRLAVEQAQLRITQAANESQKREIQASIANANYQLSLKELENYRLSSPVTGIITEIFHGRGEWVQRGQPICRITRLDEMRVEFLVAIDQIDPSVLIGSPVQIELQSSGQPSLQGRTFQRPNSPDRLSGLVTSYSPNVSALGSVRMQATVRNVRMPDQSWVLLPGMSTRLTVRPKNPPIKIK